MRIARVATNTSGWLRSESRTTRRKHESRKRHVGAQDASLTRSLRIREAFAFNHRLGTDTGPASRVPDDVLADVRQPKLIRHESRHLLAARTV